MPIATIFIGAIFIATSGAAAAAAAAQSPCAAEPYRAFDFWLGSWSVAAADGRQAGRNVISREQGGCVLVERWSGVQGSTGMSMNFYDPVAGNWRQLWVSPQTQIDIRGNRDGDSMILEGAITYLGDGRSHPFRGTWTLLPDGRVRQFFEEAEEPGIWTPWFEGFYSLVPEGAPDAPPAR